MTPEEYQKILADLRALFVIGSGTIISNKKLEATLEHLEALKSNMDGGLDKMYVINDKLANVHRELTKESVTVALMHGNASEQAVRLRTALDNLTTEISNINDNLKNKKDLGKNNDIGNEPPSFKVGG